MSNDNASKARAEALRPFFTSGKVVLPTTPLEMVDFAVFDPHHGAVAPSTITFLHGSTLSFIKKRSGTVHVSDETMTHKCLCGRWSETHWQEEGDELLTEASQTISTLCQRCYHIVVTRYPLFTRFYDTAGVELVNVSGAWFKRSDVDESRR